MQWIVDQQRASRNVCRAATWLLVLLVGVSGCRRTDGTKKPESKSAEPVAATQDARSLRNLQNAMSALQPDKLGVSSDPERAIAMLNEWKEAARQEAEKAGRGWTARNPHDLISSLPEQWQDRIKQKRFVERDAGHIRDSVWASKAAQFAAGGAQRDLDRVVNLFEYVVRNIQLLPANRVHVPLTVFDTLVLGRGSAADRAWVFAELLRQRRIDSVVLTFGRGIPSNEPTWLLVGVLAEKDILLFDPQLGVPLAADAVEPLSALPRRPMTLRQAQMDDAPFEQLRADTGDRFPLRSASFAKAQVQMICQTSLLSDRMHQLQSELSGDLSAIVSDPLEDSTDEPGLFSRVANHPAATWSAENLVIWSYPEQRLDAGTRLKPEEQKELSRWLSSLSAPVRIAELDVNKEGQPIGLKYSKPEGHLRRLRFQQIQGQWEEAVQGFVAVQLYEIDPPTSKELTAISATDKRLLREHVRPDIRNLHMRAVDDACFWLAQSQNEQHRAQATYRQCESYLERHSSGPWAEAAAFLKAVTLAGQKQWKGAIQALKDSEEEAPDYATRLLLTARWKRLLAAGADE